MNQNIAVGMMMARPLVNAIITECRKLPIEVRGDLLLAVTIGILIGNGYASNLLMERVSFYCDNLPELVKMMQDQSKEN